MTTERGSDKPTRRRRLFAHGESLACSMGFAVAGIFLAAIGAAAWWTSWTRHRDVRLARAEQVRAVGTLLARSAETMLAAGEVSAVRRLVVETARANAFEDCRIVLPGGQVVADADPSRINLQQLPPKWPEASPDDPAESLGDKAITCSFPLEIPARGVARLELVASVAHSCPGCWQVEAGLGAIGAAALAMLLFVYRRVRRRLRGVGAIREALLSYERGQSTLAELSVDARLGPEAGAWNRLLEEHKKLQKQVVVRRAKESLESWRGAKCDLSAVCDGLSQGMVFLDKEGRARFVNGAAAVFLKAKREEIVGAEVAKFIDSEKVLRSIEAAASGAARGRTAVEVQQGDGAGGGILRFTIRPMRREDPAAVLVIIEDVTQQRVADAARNAFVAQATHELRTPLTNIRLYAETALAEGERNPSVRAQSLNVINQESRRLERMIGDILSVAEIEAGSLKIIRDDVRLDAVFEELRADYDAQAGDKKIALSFNLPPKLPVIQGDRFKLVLALHNLIGNALKYTPAGGNVFVTVETKPNQLVVEVADTGIGISPEDSERIFEKFYRAEDPRVTRTSGSGLGLALAREVVRLHGGDVTVQSELDKGSSFTLTLPIAPEAAGDEDSRTTAGSGARSQA